MSRIVRAATAAALVAICGADIAAYQLQRPERQRIRSTNTTINETLDEGYRRSPTLRALIDTLEASAVLVYIEPGRCPTVHRQRLNGCLVSLGAPAGLRYLRVIVDVGLASDNLIATIGHELRHAVEANEPAAVADAHREGFLGAGARRVGGNVYETDEAQQVKEDILRELRRADPEAPRVPKAPAPQAR